MNLHKRNMRLLIDYSEGMLTKDLEKKYGITKSRIYQIFSEINKEDMEEYQEEHFVNRLKGTNGIAMNEKKLIDYLQGCRSVSAKRVAGEMDVPTCTIVKLRTRYNIVPEVAMTKDTVKETIKYLYHSSFPLSYQNVGSSHRCLLAAAVRLYGTWDSALKDAGLCFKPAKERIIRKNGKKKTEEELISEIKTLAKEGVDLSAGKIIRTHQRLMHQARRMFLDESRESKISAWGIAINKSGLDYNKIRKNKYNVVKARKTRLKKAKTR